MSRRYNSDLKSEFTNAIMEEESDSAEDDHLNNSKYENEDNEKEDDMD